MGGGRIIEVLVEIIPMTPRLPVRLLVTAICACAAISSLRAHHSHPFFYDACRSISIVGRVESVQWKDPHTLVVVRAEDGRAYTVDWNSLTGLTNNRIIGPAQAALVPEARVAVTGHPIRSSAEIRSFFPEYTHDVNPATIDPTAIRRVDDSWRWAREVESLPGCAGK